MVDKFPYIVYTDYKITIFCSEGVNLLLSNYDGQGVCLVDLEQVFEELQSWYDECVRSHTFESDLRLAMLESFSDIILNAVTEDEY